jgi:hypothetical protein
MTEKSNLLDLIDRLRTLREGDAGYTVTNQGWLD